MLSVGAVSSICRYNLNVEVVAIQCTWILYTKYIYPRLWQNANHQYCDPYTTTAIETLKIMPNDRKHVIYYIKSIILRINSNGWPERLIFAILETYTSKAVRHGGAEVYSISLVLSRESIK